MEAVGGRGRDEASGTEALEEMDIAWQSGCPCFRDRITGGISGPRSSGHLNIVGRSRRSRRAYLISATTSESRFRACSPCGYETSTRAHQLQNVTLLKEKGRDIAYRPHEGRLSQSRGETQTSDRPDPLRPRSDQIEAGAGATFARGGVMKFCRRDEVQHVPSRPRMTPVPTNSHKVSSSSRRRERSFGDSRGIENRPVSKNHFSKQSYLPLNPGGSAVRPSSLAVEGGFPA